MGEENFGEFGRGIRVCFWLSGRDLGTRPEVGGKSGGMKGGREERGRGG